MSIISESETTLEAQASLVSELPILVLNVHSHCNCRCVMCDIWKRETRDEIRAVDLESHRSALRSLGVRHVVLTGGEPLLHSDLRSLCGFFREENIRLTLLSTGLLLLKRANEVSALFDDVIVSVDGPMEIHDSIRRVNGAFRLIQDGIAALRGLRPDLPVAGRSTVQKANHRYLRATVEAARILRLDSISFLAADLSSQAFNRSSPWPYDRQSEIALNAAEVLVLEEEINQLIADHGEEIRSGYIAESAAKLKRLVLHFRAHLGQAAAEAPLCNAPWVSAVIEVDGSVRPCFFHPVIGNIKSQTLQEAINGEPAQAFRKSLDVARNPACRRCVCSLHYEGR